MGNHVHGTSITMEEREKRFWETAVSATNIFEYSIYLHFSIFFLGYSLFKRRLNIILFKSQLLHSFSHIFNSSLSQLECPSFFQEESMSDIFPEPLHIWEFFYAFTYKRQFLLFLNYRIFVLQTFPLDTSSLWFHCLSAFNYSPCSGPWKTEPLYTAFLRLPSWLVFIFFFFQWEALAGDWRAEGWQSWGISYLFSSCSCTLSLTIVSSL